MAGSKITENAYGKMPDGRTAHVYTLKNANGVEARISDYGGTILSIITPDRDGKPGDIVFGCDSLESYMKDSPYFGAIIGRCANRIAEGKFTLEGKEYTLAVNEKNQPNHLHGGWTGFDKVLWTATPKQSAEGPQLELDYLSKDGEEGYPGNLSVKAVYTLTGSNELKLEMTATTDKTTVCNLTNHSYFNLAGKGDILGHIVTIPGDSITPSDNHFIPTGEFMKVASTPFDFNTPAAVGERINQTNEQLKFGLGYDQNWILRKKDGEISLAGKVCDPSSGRVLEVFTNQPGVQFYSGNFLDGTASGKGRKYDYRTALCLEPQRFANAPNRPMFPSITLKPGETYKNIIIYKFSTAK